MHNILIHHCAFVTYEFYSFLMYSYFLHGVLINRIKVKGTLPCYQYDAHAMLHFMISVMQHFSVTHDACAICHRQFKHLLLLRASCSQISKNKFSQSQISKNKKLQSQILKNKKVLISQRTA